MMGTTKKVQIDRSDWKMDLCLCSMKILNFLLIALCKVCTIEITPMKPVSIISSVCHPT